MTILERLRIKFPVLTPPKVKAEARVAIAQDVIDTLAIGRMVAAQDGYFFVRDSAQGIKEDSYEAVALSMRMPGGKTTCNVCAIGAACLSAVSLYDKAEPVEQSFDGYGADSGDMRRVLARWFIRKQLDLIECAFEKTVNFRGGGSSWELRVRAQKFGLQYPGNSRKRLEAIMQNVIDNEGTFKP